MGEHVTFPLALARGDGIRIRHYSLTGELPEGLTFRDPGQEFPGGGIIEGTPTEPTEADGGMLTHTVTDSADPPATRERTFSIRISSARPQLFIHLRH